MNKSIILVFLTVFLLTSGFAANMWLGFENTYSADENYAMSVYVDSDDDGAADGTWDLNFELYKDGDLNTSYTTQTSSGIATVEKTILGSGDYNLVITDLNHSISLWTGFYIPEFKEADINFIAGESIFNVGDDVAFKIKTYSDEDVVCADCNDMNVYVFSSDGSSLFTFTDVDINADDGNWTEVLTIDDGNFADPGKFYILVDNFAPFTFTVEGFKAFVGVTDSTGKTKPAFAPGDTVKIKVSVSDSNGSPLVPTDVNVSVSGTALTDPTLTAQMEYSTIASNTTGIYPVEVTVTAGGYTQTFYSEFSVQSYYLEFFTLKNANSGTKEKMPGVFAPGMVANFGFNVFDTNGIVTLTESDCNDLVSSFSYIVTGTKFGKVTYSDTNKGTDLNISWDSSKKYCSLNFVSPSANGKYELELQTSDDIYGNATAHQVMTVQDLVVFLESIDPTADSTQFEDAHKFGFWSGEDVGFLAVPILLGTTAIDLNDIESLSIIVDGVSQTINSSYYSDTNMSLDLIILDTTYFTDESIGGGFYPIEAVLDGNDGKQYTAFGGFEINVFDITVDPADTNSSSAKEEFFGPPVFNTDENAGLKVTVKNSTDQAVEYANVELSSLKNMTDWEDINLQTLDYPTLISGTTNTEGSVTLNLGTLDSGVYLAEIDVNDNGTVDSEMAFFMVKNYIAFVRPMVYEDGEYGKDDTIGVDNNFFGFIMAFNPFEFEPITDITIDETTLRVFREGDEDIFKAEKVNASVDVNEDFNDLVNDMGPGGVESNGSITIYKTGGGSWEPGFYHFFIDINSPTQGEETAEGFFQVQSFKFEIQSADNTFMAWEVPFSPDGNFQFLARSNGIDVNLNISLVDEKDWEVACDTCDNITVLDTNNDGAGYEVEGDWNWTLVTVDMNIPDLALQNYVFVVEAEDVNSGATAEYEMWVKAQKYVVVKPVSQPSYQLRNAWYHENSSGMYDNNLLLDTTDFDTSICADFNTDQLGDLTYDAIVYPQYGDYSNSENDLNRMMLVDFTTEKVYIDVDMDCNFLDENTYNISDHNVIAEVELVDGGNPMLLAAEKSNLKYLAYPDDLQNEQSNFMGSWYGEYDQDGNITIPIVVLDLNSTALADVNVQIGKVMKMNFGAGAPTILTEGSDYNSYSDLTDAEGLALPLLETSQTGEYQIELIIGTGSDQQKMKYWEGPMFAVKKYTSMPNLVNKSRTQVGGDKNYGFIVDLNYSQNYFGSAIDLSDGGYESIVGVFSETDHGAGANIDHDFNTSETWYVVQQTSDGRYVIDDDLNFQNQSPEPGASKTMLQNSWPTCIGVAIGNWDNNCAVDTNYEESYVQLASDINIPSTDQNINIVFNGAMETGGATPTGWEPTSCDANVDEVCSGANDLSLVDENFYAGAKSTKMILGADNNGQFKFAQNLGQPSNDENINFYVSFWTFATSVGDNNLGVSLENGDANVAYSFNDGNWEDVNWEAMTAEQRAEYIYEIDVNTVWEEKTFDFNTQDNNFFDGSIFFTFRSSVADVNIYLDNVVVNKETSVPHIVLYNKLDYRQKPSSFSSDYWFGDWMLWTDANKTQFGETDDNVYVQIEMRNLDKTVLNVDNNSTLTMTLMKRDTCGYWWGQPTKTTVIGDYISTGFWSFNLGSGLVDGDDSTCVQYEMKIDQNMEIGGSYFFDTSWNTFFLKNE